VADPIDALVRLIEGWSGLRLDPQSSRRTLLAVSQARCAALGLEGLEAYVARVERGPLDERRALIDASTVNYTWFYRDAEQMRALSGLLQAAPAGAPLAVWVAGCSTGEDVYTLAMLGLQAGRPLQILGTDINSASIEAANKGLYGDWALRALEPYLRGYFEQADGFCRVRNEVRRAVRFEQRNLLDAHPLPPLGQWDLILCRNVLIYFTSARALEVRQRMALAMAPGGWLVQGASETLFEPIAGLEPEALGGRLALRRSTGKPGSSPPAFQPAPVPLAAAPLPAAPAALRPGAAPLVAASLPAGSPGAGPGSALALGAARLQTAPEEALQLMETALEQDPLCVEAHFCAGLALFLLGDAAAARRALRAALVLDPGLWPAAFYSALALETLGRPKEASQELERVLETANNEVPALVRASLGDFASWRSDVISLAARKLSRLRSTK
jgi:chemotaxis protein methyltransferase CheR